ncbi:hypothetical protein TNCV_4598621 [Trichonephila clavipes]|nr:hypothetical protein TNCV_4598621 [Trichonephila clavipes]
MGKEELLNSCVPHVVTHHPVGIWLMENTEFMGGPRVPTPQRCSTGCSVYLQCALQGCGSKVQCHPKT